MDEEALGKFEVCSLNNVEIIKLCTFEEITSGKEQNQTKRAAMGTEASKTVGAGLYQPFSNHTTCPKFWTCSYRI
jgi:hypothetical protein